MPSTPRFVFHLLPNAHLDPVWLWDWREGMNEALTTCRTILDLLDEQPDLTFIRGEAAVYAHIERTDPELFERIRKRVKEGRWDIVGGSWIQPDTNLPATEVLLRHFEVGRSYFASRFGKNKTPRVAWAADSFGHSAGLPEILAASGMDAIMFCRPGRELIQISKPVFWWEGCAGTRVLACRPIAPYLSEHDQVPELLDQTLEAAGSHGLTHIAFPYGVGNHGGGPTRRQIREIREWATRHPEVLVRHSGLHPFFAAVRREIAGKENNFQPVHRGELNFCLRGCYASVAKFKFAYRRMEADLIRAENTDSMIRAGVNSAFANLSDAWKTLLFNSFHDILPGSSIERAYEDQLAQVGSVIANSQTVELDALNLLAARVDTRVKTPPHDHPSASPVLVWNPHPVAFHGPLEIEAPLDYRPVFSYRNRSEAIPVQLLDANRRSLSLQSVATEHAAFESSPWRKRIVTRVQIPPMGWKVLEFGWVEGSRPPAPEAPAIAPRKGIVDNGIYRVEAGRGNPGLRILHLGKPVFQKGGLSLALFSDPWGSWGGMLEEPESIHFSHPIETWKIEAVETLESGPERAALWIRFAGKNSRLDLTVSLSRQRAAVDFSARLFFNERNARLKLILPVRGSGRATFEVPGGTVTRQPCGEVPGGRWVRVNGPGGQMGFASNGLYSFDTLPNAFRPTLARATRYAATDKLEAGEKPWLPMVDSGELKFKFLLQPGDADLERLARELEQPPVVQLVAPGAGTGLERSGSFASLSPATSRLLSIHPSGKDLIVRVQSDATKSSAATLNWLGQRFPLGKLRPGEMALWQLSQIRGQWKIKRLPPGQGI